MADAVFTSLLVHTATRTRIALGAQDADTGQPAETTSTVDIIGRLELGSANLKAPGYEVYTGKQLAVANGVWFCEEDADIQEDDTLTVSGQVYLVILVTSPGGAAHHKECFIKTVKT